MGFILGFTVLSGAFGALFSVFRGLLLICVPFVFQTESGSDLFG